MSEIFGNGVMGGGGLTNSKLALANAQAADVRSGKKFYAGDKQIKTGTLADVTQATPAITVDAAGKITASATQAAGVVAAGTKSATKQLTVQAGKTVTPSISAQTAVASQRFTTGDVKVAAVNGIIRVTYPAGDTCTCKNGSTTLTANASDGITVFIVPNTGTWTLTVTNGTKTATKTVIITATSRFANVTLAYFTATLNITYPAKSTCVIKNSSGAQVASDTNTGTAAKTWTATVGATGTYTITATATDGSGKTKSTTVSITTNGQVATAELVYEFVLYDNGIMQNGGVVKSIDHESTYGSNSAVVKDGYLYISVANNLTLANGFISVNAISGGKYSTLKVRVSNVSGDAYFRLAAKKTRDPYNYTGEDSSDEYAVLNKTSFTDGEYALDISAVKESAYYGAWIWGKNGDHVEGSCHILRLWLE